MRFGRCFICKHYLGQCTCRAFPDGIPMEYVLGEENHFVVVPDQVGDYVYEPKHPMSPEKRAWLEEARRAAAERQRREKSESEDAQE